MKKDIRNDKFKILYGSCLKTGRNQWPVLIMSFILLLLSFTCVIASDPEHMTITARYSAPDNTERSLTIDFSDEWLLLPDNVYNHKLAQASFGMAVSAYRARAHTMQEKNSNIKYFLQKAGFGEVQSDDYDLQASIDTIASAIANKKIGDVTLIAVAVSGGGYTNEWESNLSVSDAERAEGFDSAAQKVLLRIQNYIQSHGLEGEIRLWVTGYSRAAAVSNLVAADATDSGMFRAVYGYTFATPRTTKDEDTDRFDNIFNIINPFDPVPMAPFPEWEFDRYGTDLFLPSQETDSAYMIKKVRADEVFGEFKGDSLPYNPQINKDIHTMMDFILFFINSTKSYRETYQTGLVDLYDTKNPSVLLKAIAERIRGLPEITEYQLYEFNGFLDFGLQIAYQTFLRRIMHPENLIWNYRTGLQENLMHEHYDEVYRCWLFSSDDPAEIFQNDPRYIHYSVVGDTDIEIYDQSGNFVEKIFSDGRISRDLSDAKEPLIDDQQLSTTFLFAERHGDQTMIIMPMDQIFLAVIIPLSDQEVECSYVEYTAKEIRADVQYTNCETAKAGEAFVGNLDPKVIKDLTDEELLGLGFSLVEPWSKQIVYSPSAVMNLENDGIFHPTPMILITMPGLAVMLVLYIFTLSSYGATKGITKGYRYLSQRRKGQQSDANKTEYDKINGCSCPDDSSSEAPSPAEDKIQTETLDEDKNNEDQ